MELIPSLQVRQKKNSYLKSEMMKGNFAGASTTIVVNHTSSDSQPSNVFVEYYVAGYKSLTK